MLDINKIRREKDSVIELLSRRGKDYSNEINEIRKLDEKWREFLSESEELKHKRNKESDRIGIYKKEGKNGGGLIAEMKDTSGKIKQLDEEIRKIRSEMDTLLLNIPNLPAPDIDRQDKVIRECGKKKEFGFEPRTHWEIGEILKILDFKKAAVLSGSRFAFLAGEGAELERALINFMLDIHKEKFGYTEIMAPYLVRQEIMTGTGQLPKFKEELYMTQDELYLIPTAEVTLANIHRQEILEKDWLPKKYVSYTPCFRREAGSYGKDTSGLIRNHQFNKVELVNIVLPEDSGRFHDQLLAESEEVLKQLGLIYRVKILGAEDFSFSAAKTYDLEVWMSGEKKWREVSSCSNCKDFQARRMDTKYRTDSGQTEYVHTLNSSGLAVGRIFAAILENFQTREINVVIPHALRIYMKGKEIITRQKD
jgi:seryl-tRNA synthetase